MSDVFLNAFFELELGHNPMPVLLVQLREYVAVIKFNVGLFSLQSGYGRSVE